MLGSINAFIYAVISVVAEENGKATLLIDKV
jgi:hypothetical protein